MQRVYHYSILCNRDAFLQQDALFRGRGVSIGGFGHASVRPDMAREDRHCELQRRGRDEDLLSGAKGSLGDDVV